jgi:hypothetical protein
MHAAIGEMQTRLPVNDETNCWDASEIHSAHKTSGGVAPVHLRKCATARKPLNSVGNFSFAIATEFICLTGRTIPLSFFGVNRRFISGFNLANNCKIF